MFFLKWRMKASETKLMAVPQNGYSLHKALLEMKKSVCGLYKVIEIQVIAGQAAAVAGDSMLSSSYMHAMLVMYSAVTRIQHLVGPAAHPPSRRRRPTRFPRLRRFASHFVSIDPSLARTRFLIRLPSLILLYRVIFLLALISFRDPGVEPTAYPDLPFGSWLTSAHKWQASFTVDDFLRQSYIAVCFALLTSTFDDALDGQCSDPLKTFGLFSLSYECYQASKSHGGLPMRDYKWEVHRDGLFQLGAIHAMSIRKQWKTHVLIPSTVSFIFNVSCWLATPRTLGLGHLLYYHLATGLILFFIATTVLINALTQLLTEGYIGESAIRDIRNDVTLEDPFIWAILMMGIRAFKTRAASPGLGNDVGAINACKPHSRVVVNLSANSASVKHSSAVEAGFAQHTQTVGVPGRHSSDILLGGWLDCRFPNLLLRFFKSWWAVCKDTGTYIVRFWSISSVPTSNTTALVQTNARESSPPLHEDLTSDRAYYRFVRGDDVSSDEDDEYKDDEGDDNQGDSDDDSNGEEDSDGGAAGPSRLLLDDTDQDVLLSHMLSTSRVPLTRYRYHQSLGVEGLRLRRREALKLEQDNSSVGPEREQEEPRACVVCYDAPRDIICWPCRCLGLCDGCREVLSAQSIKRHRSPCCNTSVQGYSRIFIP